MCKEKIKLNGIPVYRTQDDESVKYVLFEDNDEYSNVLFIALGHSREEEYILLLKNIRELVTPKFNDAKGGFPVKVIIQEYEQSKRSKQWIQESTIKQTGFVVIP